MKAEEKFPIPVWIAVKKTCLSHIFSFNFSLDLKKRAETKLFLCHEQSLVTFSVILRIFKMNFNTTMPHPDIKFRRLKQYFLECTINFFCFFKWAWIIELEAVPHFSRWYVFIFIKMQIFWIYNILTRMFK